MKPKVSKKNSVAVFVNTDLTVRESLNVILLNIVLRRFTEIYRFFPILIKNGH